MKIEELKPNADSTTDELIRRLKIRNTPLPDMDSPAGEHSSGGYKNQYDPKGHRINDQAYRPDKPIKEDGKIVRHELVARISLALQKIIVERAVSFGFGNTVKINYEAQNSREKEVLFAINRILHDNKSYSLDRKIARNIFSSTEVAEYWYPVTAKPGFKSYGFNSKHKLRSTIFSPLKGDKLYPYFDATGDMVAFSREFTRYDADNKAINFFETYTDEEKIVWRSSSTGNTWEEISNEEITIGKIPIVYGRQDQVEWEDVQILIERLEKLLSNFADTNDYHASPKIFIEGKILGFAKKGESGAILEGEKGSKAQYLSWQHAPESVKLEIETLLRMIYSLSQTPDISFESVKGLGAMTGIALKLLFMDAHLKVKAKEEVFTEYFQRRYNILLAYVGEMNNSLSSHADAMELEPEFTPFMIDDEKSLMEFLTTANGGKPVISQKTSIKLSGLVDDVDAEDKQIQEEEARAKTFDVFETTV